MKKYKKIKLTDFQEKVIKLVLSGVAIFLFGIFVGYQLDNGAISSIQGFLFNAIGDVTDANATNSNATDTNATDANATNSNATSGNVQITDNILYLETFALEDTSAKAGDRVFLTLGTSGAYNTAASIVFKNKDNDSTFTVSVEMHSSSPSITIPTNVSSGTYKVTTLLLVGLNSDGSTFTKRYGGIGSVGEVAYYDFTSTINIVKESTNDTQVEEKLILNSMSLITQEAKLNEKVFISFNANQTLSNLKLTLANDNDETFTVYVKSLASNPYFEIPSTAQTGTYTLIGATLTTSDTTTIYSKNGQINGSEKFNFNSTLTILEEEINNSYVYNNEDITDEIITKLYNADSDSTISIHADSNPIISEDVFNTIKGTSKVLTIHYHDNQMVFNGKNITTSKSIDATINTSLVASNTSIGSLVNDGIILSFASNGNLPGEAIVRVKITDVMEAKFGSKKIYAYYYNSESNSFSVIASGISSTEDGYYEFNIDHNSDYVLVTAPLDDDLLEKDSIPIVSFQKSDKANLFFIGLGALLIVVVIVIVAIVKKKGSSTHCDSSNSDL